MEYAENKNTTRLYKRRKITHCGSESILLDGGKDGGKIINA
jgi:hypothetical protein